MKLCLSISLSATEHLARLRALSEDAPSPLPWPWLALRSTPDQFSAFHEQQTKFAHPGGSASASVLAIEVVCPQNRKDLMSGLLSFCQSAKPHHLLIEFDSPYDESPSLDTLQGLCEVARASETRIVLDVAAPRDVMRRRMEDILKLPNRPLGIAIDTGNYLVANPTSSVEVLVQRHIHELDALILRDAPPEVSGNSSSEPLPLGGDGLIDYARLAQVVRDVAFAGPCIFDLSPNLGGPLLGENWIDHPHYADAVQHLRICGWFS